VVSWKYISGWPLLIAYHRWVTNHDDEMEGTHCLVERLYSMQTQYYDEELFPLFVRQISLALAVKGVLCRGVFLMPSDKR
jgi:hypothetical protein